MPQFTITGSLKVKIVTPSLPIMLKLGNSALQTDVDINAHMGGHEASTDIIAFNTEADANTKEEAIDVIVKNLKNKEQWDIGLYVGTDESFLGSGYVDLIELIEIIDIDAEKVNNE